MGEIKPCPFCGVEGATVGGLVPWVHCHACDASGPQREGEADAISAWNTRAVAARDAEIEALRAEVNTAKGQAEFYRTERNKNQRKAERLAEALRWYANPEVYKPHPHGPAFDDRDLSFKARAALRDHDQEVGNGSNTTCDICDASIPLAEAEHSFAHSGEALCYGCLETVERTIELAREAETLLRGTDAAGDSQPRSSG